MYTGEFIRTTKFDKSMSGYRVVDVEMFLKEVGDEVDELTQMNEEYKKQIETLTAELNNLKSGAPIHTVAEKVDNSESIENVQGILVSAQRFSDQIVNEANEKAAAILDEANNKAREIDQKVAAVLSSFEKDIAERKANADAEVDRMLSAAAAKSEGLVTAAHDSVARQQLLFDKLKVQVSEFKKNLFENHKQQLEILQKFPDTVPYDPEHAAEAIAFEVDSSPDFKSFLPDNSEETSADLESAELPEQEAEPEQPAEVSEQPQDSFAEEQFEEQPAEQTEETSAEFFAEEPEQFADQPAEQPDFEPTNQEENTVIAAEDQNFVIDSDD